MANTIKIAISIQESLFEPAETIARKMNISRVSGQPYEVIFCYVQ
jgi:hypothetical protein